jgi:hypothetical protein
MSYKKFPFDIQQCSIVIGSWFQDDSRIKVHDMKPNIFNYTLVSPEFNENSIWSLQSSQVSIKNSSNRFLRYANSSDIYFNLNVKRNAYYFLGENVYPTILLNLVNLASFFFPFETQVSLSN